MIIAITGANGLVGSRIIELLHNEFTFIPIHQESCDITNKEQVLTHINTIDFDILLHLAAYTNVDGAEKKPEIAYKINVEGTKNIFDAVRQKNKKIIYVSTDFVFDGKHPPYDEDALPNPLAVYGKTKYEGEKIIGNEGMIVRISYPYRAVFEPKRDFARTIRHLLEQGKTITMVTDSLMTPTFIDDIAFSFKHLCMHYSPEIFHIVGATSLSPYDAGKLIAKVFGFNENLIQPTTYEEYFKGKALRPHNSSMISKKNNFHPMSTFEQGLRKLLF